MTFHSKGAVQTWKGNVACPHFWTHWKYVFGGSVSQYQSTTHVLIFSFSWVMRNNTLAILEPTFEILASQFSKCPPMNPHLLPILVADTEIAQGGGPDSGHTVSTHHVLGTWCPAWLDSPLATTSYQRSTVWHVLCTYYLPLHHLWSGPCYCCFQMAKLRLTGTRTLTLVTQLCVQLRKDLYMSTLTPKTTSSHCNNYNNWQLMSMYYFPGTGMLSLSTHLIFIR